MTKLDAIFWGLLLTFGLQYLPNASTVLNVNSIANSTPPTNSTSSEDSTPADSTPPPDSPIWPGNDRRFQFMSSQTSGNFTYKDSNQNNVIDLGDEGYFIPASTTKIFVAAMATELYGINPIKDDLIKSLVLSDNQASNRLIRRIGGYDKLTQLLQNKGFKHTYFERYYGEIGIGNFKHCNENNQPGICTSANDLLMAIQFLSFNLDSSQRQWLLDTLALIPSQVGSPKPDDWNHFITLQGPQKSGLSSDGQWYSSVGYSAKDKVYYVATLQSSESESIAISQLNQLVQEQLL